MTTTQDPGQTNRSVSPRQLPYVGGLDGLRAIAVLMVMATHMMLVFEPQEVTTVLAGGFLGVELFFVLSGFLITGLLLTEYGRNGRVSLSNFYKRRALRLLPALFALLAVHFTYAALTHLDLQRELLSVGLTLFYVSNWYMASGHNFGAGLQHVWSLSVEEQFYFIWPFLIVILLGLRYLRRFALPLVAVGILLLAIWTDVRWRPGTSFFQIDYIYARTDTQAMELFIGALAAFVWFKYPLSSRVLAVLSIPAAIFIALCAWELDVTEGFYYRGGLLLVGCSVAVIVLAAAAGSRPISGLLGWAPLRAIGRVSYGLYLWHLPIFFEVHRHGAAWPAASQIALAMALTVACTTASWRFVEQPFLRRKARLSVSPEAAAS